MEGLKRNHISASGSGPDIGLDIPAPKKAKTPAKAQPQAILGKQSSAGLLLTLETEDYSYYLTIDDLKKIINKRGGRYVDSVTKNTTVFIRGAVERNEGMKSGNWIGSKKFKEVEQQLTRAGTAMKQMSFQEWVSNPLLHRPLPWLL